MRETGRNRPRKSGLIRTAVYICIHMYTVYTCPLEDSFLRARVNCNNGRMQNRCWRFLRSNVARITRGLTGNEIARVRSRNCAAPGGIRPVWSTSRSRR